MLLKTTEEEERVTASLAAAKEINADAEVAAPLHIERQTNKNETAGFSLLFFFYITRNSPLSWNFRNQEIPKFATQYGCLHYQD